MVAFRNAPRAAGNYGATSQPAVPQDPAIPVFAIFPKSNKNLSPHKD